VRIGLVCPYSLHVPGGVQTHVLALASALRAFGHEVRVLAPGDAGSPEFVTRAGRAVGVPYNGSVARLAFGPVSYTRVRRWIRRHDFDVVHVHEPTAPSVSMLALLIADGPIVATYHASAPHSRALAAIQAPLRPLLGKITAQIAVSPAAWRARMARSAGDVVEIPNGVDLAAFADVPPPTRLEPAGPTVGFLGRFSEPRKGMAVLLRAMHLLEPEFPGLRLLVVGPGNTEKLMALAGPSLAERLTHLGAADEKTKVRALRGMDVYCAPNIDGESFGMVLTEAMAAGTPVIASDLDAFRRVLDGGRAGVLVSVGDPGSLARAVRRLLRDEQLRREYVAAGTARVARYDWRLIADRVLEVYEVAITARAGLAREAAE
jgi:phosphatidylinositol alpha-mannosyltransferase